MADTSRSRKLAPQFPVPDVPIVSVEHPCIIQNVDKAIRMLGGDTEIVNSLDHGYQKPLGLRFQPGDPTSREVVSYNKRTNSVLLKVTVPKRTGRKRKRGSSDEFTEDSSVISARKDSSYLLQSLTDNSHRYHAEIVGSIQSTHVWRTMPDFVYSSKGSTFLNEVKTKILSKDYPELKLWSMPRAEALGSADTEAIPPPVLSTQSLPFNHDLVTKPPKTKHPRPEKETPVEAQPDDIQFEEEDRLAPSSSDSVAQVQILGT